MENNQDLFRLKDTYRIAKEEQAKLETIRKIKLLEQEEYIWFLKHILLMEIFWQKFLIRMVC